MRKWKGCIMKEGERVDRQDRIIINEKDRDRKN